MIEPAVEPLRPAVHIAESTHFYTRAGEPAYEQQAKAGHMRPTTLADARKLQLVPSVTQIIKCAAAPALEEWKQQQTLLAALTLPRGADEDEACWLDRIRNDSREQARLAAERGTEIHAAIEQHYAGYGSPEYAVLIGAVTDAIEERFGRDAQWYAEQSFAHPLGFGGKADLLSHPTTVDVLLDIKTKETVDDLTRGFDEHLMQLAAYRFGLGRPEALCANVFVSRQEPWTVRIHEWDESELQRGWAMFGALLDYYQSKTGYDSSWDEDDYAGSF